MRSKFKPLNPEESVVRLAGIVDSSEDAIIGADLDGTINTWNTAASKLFGYTRDEVLGESILLLVPPHLHGEHSENRERIQRGERIEHSETQRLAKGGSRVDISLTLFGIRNARGTLVGSAMIARDISERRRLERARSILAAIVESSDDAIVSKNLDGIITSWNAAAERLLGYKAEEIIGQSVLRIIPPDLQHEEPGIIARLRSGQRIEHYETRRMKKNGDIFDVSLTVSPIRNEHGEVVGGSKILRDISDRRAAEAVLIEKERLAAAGRLAATLAHEVNNPLESITNLAYLLASDEQLHPEARRFAEMLLKEVQRAGDITRQTLAYYRESKHPVLVDLAEIVRNVLRSKQKRLAEKNVRVNIEFSVAPWVDGFHGELRQVLDNLVDNATDAVPPGGEVKIFTNRIAQPDGDRLVLSICDNGPGIPLELQTKIFEPFFTTKSEKGSGLGLWVSHAIIKKHNGSIHVRSNPEKRETVFSIELPAARLQESAHSVLTS